VSISISIIEDDPQTRQILADWIRGSEGFRLLSEHGSAESAIASLPGEKPALVLTDINLPGKCGIACVRQLKALLPQTQFLMLTVYKDDDNIFQALSAGASGYLLKQTPRAELISSLRQVYEGGSPMTSSVARKVVQVFQQYSHSADPDLENLTPRELEVLNLLAKAYLYKEIADSLAISLPTVATHIRRIYEKLHVHSRSQAVAKCAFIQMADARPGGVPRN
jgi:DNA-binding NarL/FixJ family response regulator